MQLLKDFRDGLNILMWYFLDPTQTPAHAPYHQSLVNFKIHVWDKCVVGRLIKGVFGTLMWVYNAHKLNKLKDHFEEVEAQHTQLIPIILEMSQKVNHTAKLAKLLKNLYKHSSLAVHTFTLPPNLASSGAS